MSKSIESVKRNGNSTDSAQNVDRGRRTFLKCGIGVACLALGGTAAWVKMQPIIEKWAFLPADGKFIAFRDIFTQGSKSFTETTAYIAERTGVTVGSPRTWADKIEDPLGLTRTARTYSFQLLAVFLPPGKGRELGYDVDAFVGAGASGGTFKTYKYNTDDGRIAALANYILKDFEARKGSKIENPLEAAVAIAGWVIQNIKMDVAHASIPPHSFADSKSMVEYAKAMGVGQTNSFQDSLSIIQKGGVCTDNSNILSDLLNAVGIPSRPVDITQYGGYEEDGKYVTKSIAHSITQVFVESGLPVYIDSSPKYSPSTGYEYKVIFAAAPDADSIVGRLERRYPGIDQFFTYITAAIPQELMPKTLRNILEQHPYDYIAGSSALKTEFMQTYREFLLMHEKDYAILYYNKYQPGSHSSP